MARPRDPKILTAAYQEESQGPTYSKAFPEGYGDLVLQSKDGMIFHFPSSLLSHSSPVFKDMCDLAIRPEQRSHPVPLEESSKVIETLLHFIDPTKGPLYSIPWDRVEELLLAAEKYQISGIFRCFEREVSLEAHHKFWHVVDPILCLVMATHHRLEHTARLALRELIKLPTEEIKSNPSVEHQMLDYLNRLRVIRTMELCKLLFLLERDSRDQLQVNPCLIHGRVGLRWTLSAIQMLIDTPRWNPVMFHIRHSIEYSECTCPIPHVDEELAGEIEMIEGEVPELPKNAAAYSSTDYIEKIFVL
ncbi:hypothetical protein CPB86DRAFT_827526 [Serendipita vermifera]|nr:hypothetical protein CPB86DRAFT_827526 [Serendipita vermifera]